MPIRITDNDFYSLHGMWGAYASLALGRFGRGAGVVMGDVQAPNRGLFIGYKDGPGEAKLLPFVPENAKVGLDGTAYVASSEGGSPGAAPRPAPRKFCSWFTQEEIDRTLEFSGETWRAGKMSFTVHSFFGSVPDPSAVSPFTFRKAACPAILLRLSLDNRSGAEPLIGIFGMQGVSRPLSDATEGRLAGMASSTAYGFALRPGEDVAEVMDWNFVDAAFNGPRPLRRLASQGGLRFRVAPGAKADYLIALGTYQSGTVTSGAPTQRYYASLFKDLEDVLEFALEHAGDFLSRAAETDAILASTPLDDYRKFMIAQGAHSYCASTELLMDDRGAPVFIVNEGEYRMMNTLDLTVDQSFWELIFSPWTVRNELDAFLDRSSYTDRYGLAFTHDQGVADCFSPRGSSSYELPGLSDCFSYMSYEETLNWALSACLYVRNSHDALWAEGASQPLAACLDSLRSRDKNGDGIMDVDSDRCEGGAEITTYDSLDISLGQARNNLYLAVKAWGTFLCLAAFFEQREDGARAGLAKEAAAAIAETVLSFVQEEGYIPAVFEGGNRSRIIPAVEGLVYPYLAGMSEAVAEDGPYGQFIRALKRHLDMVLEPGICLDSQSGGWKLSSTSRNTWLSKIFLNQFVAERILDMAGERTRRDAVHVGWLTKGSADYGATDQVDSSTGSDLGSRLYPRLVTSVLWLTPHHQFPGLKIPETT